MKIIKNLPFSELPGIPQFIKDFISGAYPEGAQHNFSIENFREKINAKKTNYPGSQRTILVQELRRQLDGAPLSDAQQSNLEALQQENTYTVTTGHQLNFFTGPAFFVYKILQTVKTAEFLSQNFPDYKFVPIFWMATEDHDFEEINHFKTHSGYYEMSGESGGAVGRIVPEARQAIAGFEEEFWDSIYGTTLIRLIKEAYDGSKNLTQATRFLVNALFSEFGVLPLDGDSEVLKMQMRDIFGDEMMNSSLKKETTKAVEIITKKYGKVQVNPREINLFLLSETRNRIDRPGEDFTVADTDLKFSREEILDLLERNPEKFSPNALMRPVFQEKILPNIAYVGGNAEIMYWLELPDYFAKIGLPFPVLIPRASMLFLSEKTLKKIEKLSLEVEVFFRPFSEVSRQQLWENNDLGKDLELLATQLRNNFQTLKGKAGATEKTFANLVEAEEVRQQKSFERMKKRLLRAEKIKHQEKIDRLRNLYLEVNPGGTWQERVLNFSVFFSDFGEEWLRECYRRISVDKSELVIMQI